MDDQLKTIRLYGALGKEFGRVHRFAVSTAAEAVSALCSQFEGFEKYLIESHEKGLVYSVFYGKTNISKQELRNDCGDKEIRFATMIQGSKKGGIFQIIVGVVLVVVGAVLTYFGIPLGPVLIKMGVGLIVGGIVQLLMPVPKGPNARERPENTPSYTFNGPVNTQAQGNPVPILYGELFIGSAVISAGINVVDQAYIPTGMGSVGTGGTGGNGFVGWAYENTMVP